MSLYIEDGPIAICDRCQVKKLRRELSSDGDSPGLLVCRDCKDKIDPWKLSFTPKDADIHVDRPRPEREFERPTTMTSVDENGRVEEGEIPTDLSVYPSSE